MRQGISFSSDTQLQFAISRNLILHIDQDVQRGQTIS